MSLATRRNLHLRQKLLCILNESYISGTFCKLREKESFGSRKWNEELGEGRRVRKRRQVWGKGQFGIVDHGNDSLQEGRVAHLQPKF